MEYLLENLTHLPENSTYNNNFYEFEGIVDGITVLREECSEMDETSYYYLGNFVDGKFIYMLAYYGSMDLFIMDDTLLFSSKKKG